MAMGVEKYIHLWAWVFGVLIVGVLGCSAPSAAPTAHESQALGATTAFIWSCPQPGDPDFNGNAGDWCLAQYGGDTNFCSGLCCPPGTTAGPQQSFLSA